MTTPEAPQSVPLPPAAPPPVLHAAGEPQPGFSVPTALLDQRPRRNAIWLVPLLALLVVGSFIVRSWWERGPRIVIEIPRATGIEAGRTRVFSRGVQIGSVERVLLNDTLERPLVVVELESWASAFASKGANFWVVSPSINFHGVSGLETLASGPILEARPGPTDAPSASRFVALSRPPSDASGIPGLRIALRAPRLGSIRAGSPVTYRDVEVGEVLSVELSADAKSTVIHLAIQERYASLARENSQFWGRGGLGLDLGMTGLKLRTESLESILGGGIAFATPDDSGSAVDDGHEFALLEEEPKNWFKWVPAFDLK